MKYKLFTAALIIFMAFSFGLAAYGESLYSYDIVNREAPNSMIFAVPTLCDSKLFIVKKPNGSVWLYQVVAPYRGKIRIDKTIVFRGSTTATQ